MDQDWDSVKDDVLFHKRESKKASAQQNWILAHGQLDLAISKLEHLLSPALEATSVADSLEKDVAAQLADCYGIKGGVYRRAADAAHGRKEWALSQQLLEVSVACYDLGYLYEACKRFEIVNSYNLLNRLISRLMLQPEALADEHAEVMGVPLRLALENAQNVLKGQTSEPPRESDPWAWGDLAVCNALLMKTPEEAAWNEFFDHVPSKHAHETTAATLQMLFDRDEAGALPKEVIMDAIQRLRDEAI